MAWNPSPEVADCREIARRRGWKQVVIVGIDPATEKFQVASYGETKELCGEAAVIGQAINALVASGGNSVVLARQQVAQHLIAETKREFEASENYVERRTWLRCRELVQKLLRKPE